ncbi:TonB-dependent receptor plug domain-containing protein, partial [Fulvivirgaceae bacterium PWU4]
DLHSQLRRQRPMCRRDRNVEGFFPLPALAPRGYILRVTEEGDNLRIIAYTNVKNFSPDPCFIYLVAQSRGVVTFAARGEITGTTLTKILPKRQFPTGITQITLFDAAQEPQCERLIFVNHQDALKLSVKADKPSYTKRSKAALDITVTDKDGAPVAGNFSLSIYDDTKVRTQDEYPMSITNYLLLTSDLAGTVTSPGYYLKDELSETRRHRDLLMMTHGWRRFTWQTVLKDSVWASHFYTEHGLVVSGKVLRSLGKKPAIGSKIKVLTTLGDIIIITADSLGRFYSDRLQYYDSVGMVIQTDNAKGKQTELQLFLDPFNASPSLKHNTSPFHTFEANEFLAQAGRYNRIADALDGKATMLKEVEITSTKIEEQRHTLYGTPDVTLKVDDSMLSYTNIFEAIQGRVAGVNIIGVPPNMTISIRGGGTPLLLVDGVPMDLDMVFSLSPNDVESVDVIKGAGAAIFGARGGNGVIAIYTKNGLSQSPRIVGIHHLRYPGFYKAREFYTPKYDVPSDNHNLPDLRSTLYWKPAIKTDSTGRAHVSFFTSDVLSSYRIVVEGISHEGVPGHGEGKMKVN